MGVIHNHRPIDTFFFGQSQNKLFKKFSHRIPDKSIKNVAKFIIT